MRTLVLLFVGLCIQILPSFAQIHSLAEFKDFSILSVQFSGFRTDHDQQIKVQTGMDGSDYSSIQAKVWILNSKNRERVWDSRKEESSRQRSEEERTYTVQLPAGNYEVYCVVYPVSGDQVNNFEDFIDLLGKKIFHWGRRERSAVKEFHVSLKGDGTLISREQISKQHEKMQNEALVSFLRVGDEEQKKQSFRLTERTSLDLYALGEMTGEDAVDYGGIQNLETGEIVWSMIQARTEPAGGSKKNRLVRETVTLGPGSYSAFYNTDDSHSNEEWNAVPPYDPEFWGMTIRTTSAGKSSAQRIDQEKLFNQNVIIALTKLRDDASETKGFTLKKPLDVRIYAVGEGVNEEMSDYGWILNHTTRKKIWTMEYDETEHAGGAHKNRMINKVIHLDKGDYSVHFMTDGSHSYNRWNSDAPFDPEHWGITVSAADPAFTQSVIAPYSEEKDSRFLVRIVEVGDGEHRRQSFKLSKSQSIAVYALGESDNREMADYAWIEDGAGRVVWEMTYRNTERAGGAKKNRLFDGTITLPAGSYKAFYKSDDSHSFRNWNDTPPDDPIHWGITITINED